VEGDWDESWASTWPDPYGTADLAVGYVSEAAAETIPWPRNRRRHSAARIARGIRQKGEEKAICQLFHCLFGNPFRAVKFRTGWRKPRALALSRTAYEERRFEDLPLLADALKEAGCTDEAILAHCRGPGPHVRGCWVVDLVLGKE
jgi:hypothetical protein